MPDAPDRIAIDPKGGEWLLAGDLEAGEVEYVRADLYDKLAFSMGALTDVCNAYEGGLRRLLRVIDGVP